MGDFDSQHYIRGGQRLRANAKSEIGALEQRIDCLEARLNTVERERDDSRWEAGELAQKLTAIETSSAWRATGPLRRAGARFPGLARLLSRAAKIVWWIATLQIYRRYSVWHDQRQAAKKDLAAPKPRDVRVPYSTDPVVSVIVSTYGQLDATLACLKSIGDPPSSCPIEVLLVDDFYPGPE